MRKVLKWLLISLTSTLILMVISFSLVNYNHNRMYIVFIPLLLVIIMNKLEINKKRKDIEFESSAIISSSAFFIIALNVISFNEFKNNFVWIIVLIVGAYLFYLVINNSEGVSDETSIGSEQNSKAGKSLFMIYYLNFSKTYDFATLINNKFIMNVNSETIKEFGEENRLEVGASNNQAIINGGISSTTKTSKSEKIHENFEIKNTKSTYLQQVLMYSKELKENHNLTEGSLIKIRNVQLNLEDQKENVEMIKLLLGGAFNGFNIKGSESGMDFEMNLSSIINSFLSECEYQLSFTHDDKVFYITIPLTGSEDFENDYSVSDLLTGKVSIIGVYKGEYERNTPFINTFFQPQMKDKQTGSETKQPINRLTQSDYANNGNPDNLNGKNGTESTDQKVGKRIFIDVIAVIQEVNFEGMNN